MDNKVYKESKGRLDKLIIGQSIDYSKHKPLVIAPMPASLENMLLALVNFEQSFFSVIGIFSFMNINYKNNLSSADSWRHAVRALRAAAGLNDSGQPHPGPPQTPSDHDPGTPEELKPIYSVLL